MRPACLQWPGFVTGEMGSGIDLHSSNSEPLMSALGKKRTWGQLRLMSALPQKRTLKLSRVMSALCQKQTFHNGLSSIFRCLEDISVTAEKVPPRLAQSLQFGMPRNQIVGRNVLSISYEVSNELS